MAFDAVFDPTFGDCYGKKRTLTVPLARSGVGSWNDNYDGAKLFFGAWFVETKYIFHFDENLKNGVIDSPILFGLTTFTAMLFPCSSQHS